MSDCKSQESIDQEQHDVLPKASTHQVLYWMRSIAETSKGYKPRSLVENELTVMFGEFHTWPFNVQQAWQDAMYQINGWDAGNPVPVGLRIRELDRRPPELPITKQVGLPQSDHIRCRSATMQMQRQVMEMIDDAYRAGYHAGFDAGMKDFARYTQEQNAKLLVGDPDDFDIACANAPTRLERKVVES
jgi:hypothetical protein